jgi:predicted secreted protein
MAAIMPIASMIAIYFLFFFLCLFVVLPFGVRTADELGVEKIPGQADSAPANFDMARTALRTGLIAIIPTALFVLNHHYGWLSRDLFDGLLGWLGAPVNQD